MVPLIIDINSLYSFPYLSVHKYSQASDAFQLHIIFFIVAFSTCLSSILKIKINSSILCLTIIISSVYLFFRSSILSRMMPRADIPSLAAEIKSSIHPTCIVDKSTRRDTSVSKSMSSDICLKMDQCQKVV
jgi:hypothetical protein